MKAALHARVINTHFGTHYTAEDISNMNAADVDEMLAWVDAQG